MCMSNGPALTGKPSMRWGTRCMSCHDRYAVGIAIHDDGAWFRLCDHCRPAAGNVEWRWETSMPLAADDHYEVHHA